MGTKWVAVRDATRLEKVGDCRGHAPCQREAVARPSLMVPALVAIAVCKEMLELGILCEISQFSSFPDYDLASQTE